MWSPIPFLLPALLYGSASASSVVHNRNNVTYNGYTINGVDSFLNIPFGQDTGGANRFTSPKAFVPVSGTKFNNTVAGHVCPQPADGSFAYQSNATNVSEDCLNLKVVRPSFATKDSKLPVMAYIYGGSIC
jgi:carboxylesterase type B